MVRSLALSVVITLVPSEVTQRLGHISGGACRSFSSIEINTSDAALVYIFSKIFPVMYGVHTARPEGMLPLFLHPIASISAL